MFIDNYPSGHHPAIYFLGVPLISFPLDFIQKSSLPFYTPPSYVLVNGPS